MYDRKSKLAYLCFGLVATIIGFIMIAQATSTFDYVVAAAVTGVGVASLLKGMQTDPEANFNNLRASQNVCVAPEIGAHIGLYCERTLSKQLREQFDEHLPHCPRCRELMSHVATLSAKTPRRIHAG